MFILNPFVFQLTGQAVDENTVFLPHFNGTDGATTTTDSALGGSAPHSISLAGNAQLDDSQSKFGSASLLLDGAGDYASIPDTADVYFDGDLTVECWIRLASVASDFGVFQQNEDNNNRAGLVWDQSAGTLSFVAKDAGALTHQVIANWSPSIDTWYHVALSREGNEFRIFVDGTDITTSGGTDADALADLAGSFYVGYYFATSYDAYLNGHIDEFRVSKGIARYTANFTPATKEFSPYLGLFSKWEFSTNANDSEGINNGTLQGDASINAGSLLLDGTGDYVSILDNPSLDPPIISISTWVKLSSIASTQMIVAKRNGTDRSYYLYYDLSINKFRFKVRLSGTPTEFDCQANTTTPVVDTWYHIVCVYSNDGDKKIYIDSVDETSVNVDDGGAIPDVTSPVYIGSHSAGSEALNGRIGITQMYNTILTQTEIDNIYTADKAIIDP